MQNTLNENVIRFTKHALQRAKERKLWKYVNKKKLFYDSISPDLSNRSILDDCVYVTKWQDNQQVVLTMYKKGGE